MSELVIFGLFIQACALVLLFARLRQGWFRYLGAIFILMAVFYHGVSEIFAALFPEVDSYRSLFGPAYADQFILLVSTAILAFTVAYCCAIGRKRQVSPAADPHAVAVTASIFDYRVLLLVTGPLLVLTLGGQGYASNGGLNSGTGVGTVLGLTEQFFILGVMLSGLGLIIRFGQRWFLPVLGAQSLLLALVGERRAILVGAVMLVCALARMGLKIRRRQAYACVALLLVIAWAVTAARGAEGRYASTSGASVRLTFLTTGVSHLFSASTGEEIVYTLGYRLDGDSYGAMSLEALASGSSPVGLTPLKNDVLLAIPSFLYPQKDQSNVADRSEKLYVEENLPIPELQTSPGVYIDILPTQLGGLTGILGPVDMICAAFILGLAFAALDRWLARRLGPMRMLIFLGFLYSVLDYEGSWDTYTTTARGIFLLIIFLAPIVALKQYAQDLRQRTFSSAKEG